MCTVDDPEELEKNLIPEDEPVSINGPLLCRKCTKVQACVRLRRKDVYCKDCFLSTTTHKFRSILGKSKKMSASDKVLVAVSGSQSSVALLHMLWKGQQEEHFKKLYFQVVCCYVDEGALLNQNLEQRTKTIEDLRNIVSSYGFEFYKTTLNKSLHDHCLNSSDTGQFEEDSDKVLLDLFRNTKTMSAKEDLLLRLRNRLLVKIAEELSCNKIFTAENQTGLAIKLLVSISEGRGEQLRFEVGFKDKRCNNVMLLRPLVGMERKEIALYNKFYELECPGQLKISHKMAANTSIHSLTEQFVVGLHSNFQSTVSTIYRTGEKLASFDPGSVDPRDVCVLCHGNFSSESSSTDTTAMSAACKNNQSETCCGGNENCNASSEFSPEQLASVFCYGCFLIIRDMDTINLLPVDVLEEINRRCSLNSMREQIADFLL